MRKLAMLVAATAILSAGVLLPLRPMPVATGWARPDIIGIGTAPVLTGFTHTSACAVMAVAGIARDVPFPIDRRCMNSYGLRI